MHPNPMETEIMSQQWMDVVTMTKPQNIQIKPQYNERKKLARLKSRRSPVCRAGMKWTCMMPWAMHNTAAGVNLAYMDKDAKISTCGARSGVRSQS